MIHVTGRDMTHAPFRAAYHPDDIKALIDLVFADRLVFHKGDVTLAPGIEFLLVGGHARGQAILRVHTARGWVILASDAVHVFDEVELGAPVRHLLRSARHARGLSADQPAGRLPRSNHPRTRCASNQGLSSRRFGLEGQVLRLDKPPSW